MKTQNWFRRWSLVVSVMMLFQLAICPSTSLARRTQEPVFAASAEDAALTARIASLGPDVNPAEARRVVFTAYTTGRELRREWRVVWPPGLQNFLVNRGSRRGDSVFNGRPSSFCV